VVIYIYSKNYTENVMHFYIFTHGFQMADSCFLMVKFWYWTGY